MSPRISHHFQADQKLHIARRSADCHRPDALSSLASWELRPLLVQVFVRLFLTGYATIDTSTLWPSSRQSNRFATCGRDIIARNRVGHIDQQAEAMRNAAYGSIDFLP